MIQSIDTSKFDELAKKVIRCSICTGIGHNKSKCPSNPDREDRKDEGLGLFGRVSEDFPEERKMVNISSHYTQIDIQWMNELIKAGRYPSRSELLRYAFEDFKLRNTVDADKNAIFDDQIQNLQNTVDSLKESLENQPKQLMTNFFNFFTNEGKISPNNLIGAERPLLELFDSKNELKKAFNQTKEENFEDIDEDFDFDDNSLICDICSRSFKNERALTVHHYRCSKKNGSPKVGSDYCDLCGDRLKNWKGVKLHKYHVHNLSLDKTTGLYGPVKLEVCSVCNSEVKNLSNHTLQMHPSPKKKIDPSSLLPGSIDAKQKFSRGPIGIRLFEGQLQLKKTVIDEEFDEEPQTFWMTFKKSEGTYKNISYSFKDNILEITINSEDIN